MRQDPDPHAPLSILLTGVGGQGVVTAAGWLSEAASSSGHRVVVGQAHNMSRRGGCSSSVVIIDGGSVPELPESGADVLVAAEPMEAARLTACLRPGGVAVVDPFPVPPAALAQAGQGYPPPALLLLELGRRAGLVLLVEAQRLARELGRPESANLILLGALQGTGRLPWTAGDLERAVLALALPEWAPGITACLRAGLEQGRRAAAGLPACVTRVSTPGGTS